MYRTLEWLFAAILLLITVPIMAVIVALIRVESRGNPILVQTRVGRHEKPFRLYKLRTMRQGTPIAGSHEVSAGYVTACGAWLRRTKVDELPQLWNVVLGQMRLVGPRPCLPTQSDVIAARRARSVFDVAPGITGAAQVSGIDMSRPEQLAAADADYIARRTALGDLALLWQTFTGRGRGDAIGSADR